MIIENNQSHQSSQFHPYPRPVAANFFSDSPHPSPLPNTDKATPISPSTSSPVFPTYDPASVDNFLNRQRRMFSSEDEAVFNNFVSTLKIGTHNINGLRCNVDRLDNLIEFMKLEKIDIMTLTDTNISSRDGQWTPLVDHARDFSIIWSDKDPDKIKGSGLACIINHKWRKYFWKADKISPYFMNVRFLLKGLIICVWIIYAAPADPSILPKALAHIQKECSSSADLESPDKFVHIVTGDFNKTTNGRLDRIPQNDSHNDSIFFNLSQAGLGDAFRAIYPNKVEFSWSNGSTSTRIDYIWIPN